MSLFKFFLKLPYIFIVFLALEVPIAEAASNWQDQPQWASEPSSSPRAMRKVSFAREAGYRLFPFAPGSNNLALDVGQIFLMGDLGANYSDSIGSQLHYTYGVSDIFAFDSSLGYSDHSDGNFSMTTAIMGLRTNLAWYDKVIPYAVLGMGFYRPSYQITEKVGNQFVNNSVSPLLFGIHLGGGVDLELTRQLYFGASLTFHDVFSSSRSISNGSISVGGAFISFLLHAGVTF